MITIGIDVTAGGCLVSTPMRVLRADEFGPAFMCAPGGGGFVCWWPDEWVYPVECGLLNALSALYQRLGRTLTEDEVRSACATFYGASQS